MGGGKVLEKSSVVSHVFVVMTINKGVKGGTNKKRQHNVTRSKGPCAPTGVYKPQNSCFSPGLVPHINIMYNNYNYTLIT
jgi:hypothetical protein